MAEIATTLIREKDASVFLDLKEVRGEWFVKMAHQGPDGRKTVQLDLASIPAMIESLAYFVELSGRPVPKRFGPDSLRMVARSRREHVNADQPSFIDFWDGEEKEGNQKEAV
jgi:hypothetical protein